VTRAKWIVLLDGLSNLVVNLLTYPNSTVKTILWVISVDHKGTFNTSTPTPQLAAGLLP